MREGRLVVDENREDIKYRFHQFPDCKQFQEDLRDKYLIDTYDLESIKTHERGWGFVTNQDLKIWCDREEQTHTISFFADHIREHLEFPLDWFSPEITIVTDKRLVQLTFLKNAGTVEAMLRPQSFIRRFSTNSLGAETIATDTTFHTAANSMRNSPQPSVSTMGSNLSALGPSQTRVQQLARLAESYKFLRIEFTRNEKAQEDNDSMSFKQLDRFCKLTFKKIFTGSFKLLKRD
jgi:hypothetical protein